MTDINYPCACNRGRVKVNETSWENRHQNSYYCCDYDEKGNAHISSTMPARYCLQRLRACCHRPSFAKTSNKKLSYRCTHHAKELIGDQLR